MRGPGTLPQRGHFNTH